MYIISHRGLINGKDERLENNPDHIRRLLQANIQVEIDVWVLHGNNVRLGHDSPHTLVDINFLRLNGLWCHAKNLEALIYLKNNNIQNYFFHQQDDFTLTSSGYIWTYPGKSVSNNSIIVDTDKDWREKQYNCAGVCVDYISATGGI